MLLPHQGQRLATKPQEELAKYPWRFRLGDTVYLRGRSNTETYEVIGGELWLNFPHLHVRDITDNIWRVPQLHCSSKPITFKKN